MVNNNKIFYQIKHLAFAKFYYLQSLMRKHLTENEFEVLRLSYGLDCEKHSAKEIAQKLNIIGVSDYVRISELKKQAVKKLIENVDHSQVIDYL